LQIPNYIKSSPEEYIWLDQPKHFDRSYAYDAASATVQASLLALASYQLWRASLDSEYITTSKVHSLPYLHQFIFRRSIIFFNFHWTKFMAIFYYYLYDFYFKWPSHAMVLIDSSLEAHFG
jgi:hypothetical protein